MAPIPIATSIIVHAPAQGVDLVELKRTIDQKITEINSSNYKFIIRLAFESSSSKPFVGVYHPDSFQEDSTGDGPDVTVPFVCIDIIYDASSMAAVSNSQTFYEKIPDGVKEVVTAFLAPTVDIGKIQFTKPLLTSGGPNDGQFHFDVEMKLKDLEAQRDDLIRSKL